MTFSGFPNEIGLEHGTRLKQQIRDALSYYRSIFNLPDNAILQHAEHFRKTITDFNQDYSDEILAIAKGAELDPLWIYAINARTEILAINSGFYSTSPSAISANTNECTTMCFTKQSILGQTWDWGKPLEDICALMQIESQDGHVIQMLSEPGIIGKIGMNNAGLGACLNILSIDSKLDGVPIHVMLRAILDCKSAAQAVEVINFASGGKSSNVIVADAKGNSFDTEFAGDDHLWPKPFNDTYIHTNHYLGAPINDLAEPAFADSQARLSTAIDLVDKCSAPTVENMKQILSDRANTEFPIFSPYVTNDFRKDIGTVATFVMDLPNGEMHIRKGNREDAAFETIKLI